MATPITKEKLAEIGKFIAEGMSKAESCVLADVALQELISLEERNEKVRDYLERRKIKFKYNHIKELQKSKSVSNSQWLLEKLRPEEFGPKSKQGEGTTINIISQIIKEIQNDNQPIVNARAAIRVESGPESNEDPRERILSALN